MRRLGYLYVALGGALFATNGVMSRIIFDAGMQPRDLAAWRVYGATLVLLLALAPVARRIRREDLLPIGLFGLFGIVLAQGFYYEAISRLDIAVALVIVYTAPIVVAAYQRLRFHELLPWRAYVAMVAAIAGVAVAVLSGAGGIGALSTAGLLFALATMLTFAAQVVLAAKQPRSLPPLARTGAGMLAASLIWLAVIPVWTLPFGIAGQSEQLMGRVHLDVPIWFAIAYVVVLGTAAPYLLLIVGATRIGPGAASMVGMAEPIVASIVAWLVLGQSLTPLQSLGIVVTIAGIAVVEQARLARGRAQVELIPSEL